MNCLICKTWDKHWTADHHREALTVATPPTDRAGSVACSERLSDIWHEAQSELYDDDTRASGRSLDFGHIGIAEFVLWYQHRAENEEPGEAHISKFDVQSVMRMFETWVKAPLSDNARVSEQGQQQQP